MNPEELRELSAVVEARKKQAEAKLFRVRQKEKHIRDMLGDITEKFAQGVAHASGNVGHLHGLGAYQAWVDFSRRKRAALNRDLALVLAEKSECTEELRQHFGKEHALSTLVDEAVLEQKRNAENASQDKLLQAYIVMRSSS